MLKFKRVLTLILGFLLFFKRVWCNGSIPVSKTVDGSSNLSTRAEKRKNMKKYIIESIQELNDKVTWPTWAQLQSSTILVAISSVIIAAIISLMDLGFDTILGEFYSIF